MRSQRSSQSPASSLEAPIQDHDIPDARSMDHACRDAAMADTGTTAASTIGQGRVRAGMWEAGHRAALLLNQKKVNTEWPGPPPPEHTIVVYPHGPRGGVHSIPSPRFQPPVPGGSHRSSLQASL
ncbi:hypothetical protein C8Q76DRAFT_168737 [Earliella scabrosa]|nr:hypothetical protein C8Q76DRAFT_168737 [Earliella scabrosa]